MSTMDTDDVVLLVPEVETVPEHGLHQDLVDLAYAGLAAKYVDDDDVAVFCRLAWFPDREDTRIRLDPDVMVVMGRPPGRRKSYKAWIEDDVAPAVLIEVASEDDTDARYRTRLSLARRYGAGEVVMIAPFAPGGVRIEHLLPDQDSIDAFRTVAVSTAADAPIEIATLGIRIAGGPGLQISDEHGIWPDTPSTLTQLWTTTAQAEAATARAARLEQQLRAAGIDPDLGA